MPIIVKCQTCAKEKKVTPSYYARNKTKMFFCSHKCVGEHIKKDEFKLTKPKYKIGDILGCYLLINFYHRIKGEYHWLCKCTKCGDEKVRKIGSNGMTKTLYCSNCVKEKYVNYKTPEEYIRAKVKIDKNGCWLWKGYKCPKRGYAQSKYRHIPIIAHQFSYMTFKGEIPKGMCVCHTCDVRHCVNPEHLFLGTHKDNAQDMINKGRELHGERAPSNKLKEYEVIQIRKLRKEGWTLKELAEKFKVTFTTIHCICVKKTWKYLEEI